MRGNKKVKSALMLSVMLSTVLMTLAIAPAFAGATIKAPWIVEPLLGPESTFTIDILVNNVVKLWGYRFTLAYNKAVLTATYATPVRVRPILFVNTVYLEINADAGYVIIEATRATGDLTGITTTFPLPIASISFTVVGRGVSAFDLKDQWLKDVYMNIIESSCVDGVFNNKWQGVLSAPKIVDDTLAVGSYFDVFIYAREVTKLWGYQFILSFDPEILAPYETMGVGIFEPKPYGPGERGPEEIGYDYVATCYTSYYGDKVGLTVPAGSEPVAVCRITFQVLREGVSVLDLHDSILTNVYAIRLIHGVEDGSVATTTDIYVALDTGFVESHHFYVSEDPIATVTGQIKSTGTGWTKARVEFRVLSAGAEILKKYSPEIWIAKPSTERLSADIDLTTELPVPGTYRVEIRVQFRDVYATWVYGLKGSSEATRTLMAKSFTVEA